MNKEPEEQTWLDAMRMHQEELSNAPGKCPDCKGLGYVEGREGGVKKCQCEKSKLYARFYANANIPAAYYGMSISTHWNLRQDASGENLDPAQMNTKERIGVLMTRYEKVMPAICGGASISLTHSRHVTSRIRSLCLEGGKDSGKTFLAACLAMTAVRSGMATKYIDFAHLYSTMQDFEMREERQQFFEDFATRDFIVVDNVKNLITSSDTIANNFDRLSRARLNAGKVTILTSGETLAVPGLGAGWHALTESCFVLKLPSPKPKNW